MKNWARAIVAIATPGVTNAELSIRAFGVETGSYASHPRGWFRVVGLEHNDDSQETGSPSLPSRDAPEIGRHTIALLLAIASIALVHRSLDYLLGPDARFYDRVFVRYVIDAGHLVVLARFIIHLLLAVWRRP